MKPLMPPINTPDNLFHDGNPTTGVEGTIVPAEHLNNEQGSIRDVQSELIAILTAAKMVPDSTVGQLLAALNKLYAPGNDNLGALASLVGAANKLPYFTGPKGATLTDLTKVGRDIIGQTDIAAVLQYLRIVDATTSQKGLVRLNGGVTNESNGEAATPGAVKIAYDAAMNAFNLAKTKYTADGATTAVAGLVQLVNSMGGSNALVMPQAAVTTAIQTYPSLGKGQTLQDLRGSRGVGVTYTNSTGFPIAVYVRITGGTSANLYAYVDGKEYGGGGATASQTSIATAFFIVPNNTNYRVDAAGVSTVLQAWTELR
ncbi:tail fiber protein [Salmonella enterica]